MTDLVVVSLEAWDEVWRRNQNLVAGLLRTDPDLRVLFVEPPADPLHDMASRRRPRFGHGTRPVTAVAPGRLWTRAAVKWLPRRWRQDADARLARGVIHAARLLGFARPVLWINDPRSAALSVETGWPTVYDMTDDWLAADRPDVQRERLAEGERILLTTAAEVVACSAELVRRKSPEREGEPIELIPNAVDVAAYRRPAARPADLPAGRTAVYVGTLHEDRLDVDLCVRTGEELEGTATVVLVGPALLGREASARLEDAGVLILGPRPHEEVVGYLQHADVLLVPHLVDAFTDSLDPIKLYEYQAVGRAVVATPVAGFRDVEDSRISLADAGDFPQAVRAAVEASVPFPEGAEGPVADWSDRVRAMSEVIQRAEGSLQR